MMVCVYVLGCYFEATTYDLFINQTRFLLGFLDCKQLVGSHFDEEVAQFTEMQHFVRTLLLA